tara:strand:- start:4724 stop:5332 length:609 start_codon:yes stop_codon:yes gene_type:complete
MIEYPTIQGLSKFPKKPCVAFYKYDGSNLRWEWQSKNGWCKQGTRHHLFDETDEVFGEAISIFKNTFVDELDKIFRTHKKFRGAKAITVFTEFFGLSSFAGVHEPDEPKELILFDVNYKGRGMVGPSDFVKIFGKLKIPEVIYEGKMNQQFVDSVRAGDYDLNEGVVCKGLSSWTLWMAKIKTEAYLQRLKNAFKDNWMQFA